MVSELFDRIPENFFAPLASPNRRHYAELLLRFYELFLEYHAGVERPVVIEAFSEYLGALNPAEVAVEDDGSAGAEAADSGETTDGGEESRPGASASHFLRRLIRCGWVDEEENPDFSRAINLRDTARPFLEAMHRVSRGSEVEYESHVVAIYSSLESDSADDRGDLAVVNAHNHTRLLLESLKVLDQNIKGHLQRIFSPDASVPELLHAHYDVYMHEVIDRAYTRLKTSDNLSRYRPRINRRISHFLKNDQWMERTAGRLSVIRGSSTESAREELRRMLVEIRSDLQAIDPLMERIDDRNRRYSRISTERIRTHIHADHGVTGGLVAVIRAWADGTWPVGAGPESLVHTVYRLRHISRDSLYTRRARSVSADALERVPEEPVDAEAAEREMVMRARGQLSPRKVAAFLGAAAPNPGDRAPVVTLLTDVDSYIRVLYAAAYAEGRPDSFPYAVEWSDAERTIGRFRVTDHTFIRRYPHG